MEVKLINEEYDWLATRLTPRNLYPPKPKVYTENKDLTAADLNPKPIAVTVIPGAQGIGVRNGKYKGERCLLIHLACATPFTDEIRAFAKKNLAAWNNVFNTWDIPILSQNKINALNEVWEKVEEAYFELPWSVLELHWHYAIGQNNLEVLSKKIKQLNKFWETGVIDYIPAQVNIVYQGFTKQELERQAIASFYEHLPQAKWNPKQASKEAIDRLCVNYLRHKCSSYHVLLQSELSYLKVFRDINEAIAKYYPWLFQEAKQQIERKNATQGI